MILRMNSACSYGELGASILSDIALIYRDNVLRNELAKTSKTAGGEAMQH